ncbi:MAG TPA: iron-sulfur cluster repair di-iron protein, ric [Bacilli bacterium]|nr:iron-sulfur cluster repair di-iron protein, ric [Bacilli bacterium]
MSNKQFTKLMKEHQEKLVMFVPIVARVHGPTHPEFNDVKIEFDLIMKKYKKGEQAIAAHFMALREITNNYEVPHDVCETYAAVYEMLAELDQALQVEG